MNEVTIEGAVYVIGVMDARRQLHVARRLAPVMSSLANQPAAEDDLSARLGLMSKAVAEMSDVDTDYVINSCLSICQRKNDSHNGVMSPVMASNGRMMFEDISLPAMLQLVWAVIEEKLGSFFVDLQSNSAQEVQPAE